MSMNLFDKAKLVFLCRTLSVFNKNIFVSLICRTDVVRVLRYAVYARCLHGVRQLAADERAYAHAQEHTADALETVGVDGSCE